MKEEEKIRWRIRANTAYILRCVYWTGACIVTLLGLATYNPDKLTSFFCIFFGALMMYLTLKSDVQFKKRLEKIGEYEEMDTNWREVLSHLKGRGNGKRRNSRSS